MIKLLIIGHIGNDAVLKEVNGKNVISFNVAHTDKFKDPQGVQKEKTTWVSCSYWTDRTAVAPYLKKGTLVFVEGVPEAEGYTNKEGQHVAALRLRVMNVQLLGGAKGEGVPVSNRSEALSNGSAVSQLASAEAGGDNDDLPF